MRFETCFRARLSPLCLPLFTYALVHMHAYAIPSREAPHEVLAKRFIRSSVSVAHERRRAISAANFGELPQLDGRHRTRAIVRIASAHENEVMRAKCARTTRN